MTDIDWSKGPTDATHWGPDTALYHECFYKKSGDTWMFAAGHTEWKWSSEPVAPFDEERMSELVERNQP